MLSKVTNLLVIQEYTKKGKGIIIGMRESVSVDFKFFFSSFPGPPHKVTTLLC